MTATPEAIFDHITDRPLNRDRIMKQNPTWIGTVDGIVFFEHPTRGDTAPLVMVLGDRCALSTFWDLPHSDEIQPLD